VSGSERRTKRRLKSEVLLAGIVRTPTVCRARQGLRVGYSKNISDTYRFLPQYRLRVSVLCVHLLKSAGILGEHKNAYF